MLWSGDLNPCCSQRKLLGVDSFKDITMHELLKCVSAHGWDEAQQPWLPRACNSPDQGFGPVTGARQNCWLLSAFRGTRWDGAKLSAPCNPYTKEPFPQSQDEEQYMVSLRRSLSLSLGWCYGSGRDGAMGRGGGGGLF